MTDLTYFMFVFQGAEYAVFATGSEDTTVNVILLHCIQKYVNLNVKAIHFTRVLSFY